MPNKAFGYVLLNCSANVIRGKILTQPPDVNIHIYIECDDDGIKDGAQKANTQDNIQ